MKSFLFGHSVSDSYGIYTDTNAIVFRSVVSADLSFVAFVNLDGSFFCMPVPTIVAQIKRDQLIYSSTNFPKRWFFLILACLTVTAYYLKNIFLILFLLTFLFSGRSILGMIRYCWSIKFGRLKSLGRYRASLHMLLNSCAIYNRIPTLDEIWDSSMLYQKCELLPEIYSAIILGIPMIVLILCILPFNTIIGIISIMLILLWCYAVIFRYTMFDLLQYLLMNPPTQKDLEFALFAMKNFYDFEQDLINGVDPEFLPITFVEL